MVSNSVKDVNQRRGFVLDMLKEPIGVWVGEEVTNAVSSPDVSGNIAELEKFVSDVACVLLWRGLRWVLHWSFVGP